MKAKLRCADLCLPVALGLVAAPLPAAEHFDAPHAQGTPSRMSLRGGLQPAAADRQAALSLFLLAVLPDGRWFARTGSGWQPAQADALPSWQQPPRVAERIELELFSALDLRGLAGTALYLGYGREDGPAGALADSLQGRKYQLIYQVPDAPPAPVPQLPASVPACPADASQPLLGTLPLDPGDFLAWRPLGFMSPPIHMFPAKHAAFSMTPPGQIPQPRPLRSPAAATVSAIYEAQFSATGKRNYQVFMQPCRELRLYFGHLDALAPRLQAAFAAAPPQCNSFSSGDGGVTTTCRREDLALPLQEAEVFGSGPDSAGVDFGAIDFRRMPAAFIERGHYDPYYPYYVAPTELFQPGPRAQLEAKSGSVLGSARRSQAPLGGSHMQDLPGTAQGNWFLPDRHMRNSSDLSDFLGLARDYADPSRPLLAVGRSIPGLPMGLYSYVPGAAAPHNPELSRIRPGAVGHCIDSFRAGSQSDLPLASALGALLLALPDERSLRVQYLPGRSCAELTSWAPGAAATLFVR